MRPEEYIHIAIADRLRLQAKDCLWFHVPNGGWRYPAEAKKFRRMGVLAGVSDFIILKAGKAYALEIKAEKGRLTPDQGYFLNRWQECGGEEAWAKGLDSSVATLKRWGIIP